MICFLGALKKRTSMSDYKNANEDQRYGTSSLSLAKKRVCLGKRQSLCRSDANLNANVSTKQEQTQVI